VHNRIAINWWWGSITPTILLEGLPAQQSTFTRYNKINESLLVDNQSHSPKFVSNWDPPLVGPPSIKNRPDIDNASSQFPRPLKLLLASTKANLPPVAVPCIFSGLQHPSLISLRDSRFNKRADRPCPS
jgi:hypothetical protein